MNKPLRRFGILLSLLVSITVPAQPPSPPSPQYAEEIEVRVIDVDVVVTDRHGNPLANLTRAAVATEANALGVAVRADRPKVDGWVTVPFGSDQASRR